MSKYIVAVSWERKEATFTDNKYNRLHHWKFDGGETVPASSSPQVVSIPLSDSSAVDPEEAFIASLSSCHMLWFLSIAAKRGFIVDQYDDEAKGLMGKDENGKLAITEVTLQPDVKYLSRSTPSIEEDAEIHREAHQKCFIANSVRTEVSIESSLSKTNAV
jgi:organic hydroperoxide reductase OsmC/OhrA